MIKKSLKGCLVSVIGLAAIITSSSVYAANTDVVVALDPGHGGGDPGASAGGLVESDLTWKIATRVKAILDRTSGITGVLTKKESENLNREQRTINAQNNNADLLVSFHINSSEGSNRLSGAEVYVTHSRAQKRYYEYSSILGNDILNNLRNVGVRSYSNTPKVRIGSEDDKYSDGTIADYYGIISWPIHKDIPAVLVEHAFINNPYDRANYLNDSMLTKMAEADAKAIIKNKELFRRNYYGTINTGIYTLDYIQNKSGNSYIGGYIDIAEWVGNDCRKPSTTPKLTLKSTDGTVNKEMFVSYQNMIRYYFDTNIDKLDLNKEYYIEAELTGSKNIAPESKKIQRVSLPNKTLKQDYKERIVKVINNKIVFSEGEYSGDIKTNVEEVKLVQNSKQENYIAGFVNIEEIVNGVSRNPRSMPEIRLKSTDGTVNLKTYVGYEGNAKYYFDKNIQYLDTSKEYYIEISLTTEDNISKNKTQKLAIGNKEIGKFDVITVNAKNDNFVLNYIGTINTELNQMKIIQNAKGDNYISGNIYIAEWVGNDCKKPSTTPKMTLKSTDGKIQKNMYVNYENGIGYYYDVNIEKLDKTREYYIEVDLTNPNNMADENSKKQTAKMSINGEVGTTTDNIKVITNKNIIKFVDSSLYEGTINTEINQIKVIQSGDKDYISGYIYVAEWVNGECKTPKEIPEIKLKARDGSYETKMYVGYESGIKYYFDKYIGNLDTNKEYYMEVKLSGKKNIAPEESKKQEVRMKKDEEIGRKINGDKVVTEGNNIKIKADTYEGNINTELYKMQIIQNGAGQDYISGYIYVAEWVKGECRTPREIPELSLKSTDGKFETKMYVGYEGGIKYYFDKYIGNLDTNKEYYINVKLTGKNNIAPEVNKTQTARITPQGEIGRCKNGNIVQVKGNNIKIVKDTVQTLSIKQEERTIKPNKIEEQEKTNISSEEGKEKEQQENKTIKVESKEKETNEEIEEPKENEEQQEKIEDIS